MTDHTKLKMHREHVRVTNHEMLDGFLKQCYVADVAFHDEPYPYVTALNYGYEWGKDAELILWMHMAFEGHRIELIKQDPRVAVSIWSFLDRAGHKPYRDEMHDYRSILAYGTAEIIAADDDPELYLHGFGELCAHNFRPRPTKIEDEWRWRLRMLKITCPAELVIGKMQYDYTGPGDIEMPSLADVDEGRVDPRKVPPYAG